MRHVTFFHKDTGILHRVSVMASNDGAIELNTPADHLPIDHPPGAMLEWNRHKVDVKTGQVVELPRIQVETPGLDIRWVHIEIARLEAAQHRPIRELALNPENDAARASLVQIDQKITELRSKLSGRA